MTSRLQSFYTRHKEILLYLLFGVLTTAVGWIVYFTIFWSWKAVFAISPEDTVSGCYLAGYTTAQAVQWIAAVLFAFFTNRKWVFTNADRSVPLMRQLVPFAGGRALSFFLDYAITYFGALVLSRTIPSLTDVTIFSLNFNGADVLSKLVAAVVVIILNYIFSKLFVFRNSRNKQA